MAQSETSKFSGALARLKGPGTAAAVLDSEPEPVAPPPAARRAKAEPQKVGRAAGKRSDPEFRPTTLILREQTIRTARRKLEDTKAGLDLSELVEKLLTNWNK